MADPMWSGGPAQFQDAYPWVWALMSAWQKEPFYPTDPPRDPGAFADSIMPMCDLLLVGQYYGYFWIKYTEEYAVAWNASPPGTSTTTPVIPDAPADTYFADAIAEILDRVERIETNIGAYTEGQTVRADLAAVWAQLSGGQEVPPPVATIRDTNIILAALYYVAQSVIVPAWSVDNTEVLAAVDAAKDAVQGDIETHDTLVNGKLDSVGSSLVTIDSIVDTVNVNVSAVSVDTGQLIEDVADIIDLFGEGIPPAEGGGAGVYPGLAAVTVGDTVNITGPTTIQGPLDGLLITVSTVPSGQSVTQTPNGRRYKGLGWVVFMTGEGEGEQLQKIEHEKLVVLAKSISTPASAEVYCKTGSALAVKPFTITA